MLDFLCDYSLVTFYYKLELFYCELVIVDARCKAPILLLYLTKPPLIVLIILLVKVKVVTFLVKPPCYPERL